MQQDAVLVPAQAIAFAGNGRGLGLGVDAVHLQVAELGVGDQLPLKMNAEPIPVPKVITRTVPSTPSPAP